MNRRELHAKIEELSAKLRNENQLFSEQGDLKVLDIDLLRKTTIEIYEAINMLRLAKSDQPEAVQPEPIKVKNPEPIAEPVEEAKEAPILEDAKAEMPSESIAPEAPVEMEIPYEEVTIKTPPQVTKKEEKTLNQVKPEQNDLAAKYSSNRIQDLKRSISIAKKFEFINSLFKGNHENYTRSIHYINTLSKGDEAFDFLNQLRKEHKWDEEDPNYLELADLVRRRFLG